MSVLGYTLDTRWSLLNTAASLLGRLMAHSFVSILLGTANDSHGPGLAVG